MASLKIEGLEKKFPGVQALSNINLEIKSGEFFTLLGPSGCGKTTLLRTIAGFEKQDEGRIIIDDKPIDQIPAYKRDTGMVFQDYAVFPHMTIFENVAFGLKNRKIQGAELKTRVEKALQMTQLIELKDRTPDQLSGGQQQRVGLARAMVIEPKVLLMDEPLSNLDAKLRIDMREEIRDMQRMLGITTIYVTHDQEEALVISDRIAVMHQGLVLQTNSPWKIYREPANELVASFVGHMNILEGDVRVSDQEKFPEVQIGQILLKIPKNPGKDRVRLAIRPEEIRLITEESPSKEEGFNYLSGKVRKISFTGSVAHYFLECPDNIQLTVVAQRPNEQTLQMIDKNIEIKFPLEAIMVFDSKTGARL